MAIALPYPYAYHPDELLVIPNQLTGKDQYWPFPYDLTTGELVTEERANQLFHDLLQANPAVAGDIMDSPYPDKGMRDEGERVATNAEILIRQGNRVSRKFITGGFAAYPAFPRVSKADLVPVITKELLPVIKEGNMSVEEIGAMEKRLFLMDLVRSMTPADWLEFKAIGIKQGALCECTDDDVADTYTVIELYGLADSTTPTNPTPTNPNPTNPTPAVKPDPVVRVDYHSCDGVGGWSADQTNTGVPQTVDLFTQFGFEATVTPTKVRPDVAKYLTEKGYKASESSLFGWDYVWPAKYRMGEPISVQVFASGTKVEAGYNAPQATGVCGIKPGGGTPPAAYVVQNTISGPPSLTAAQTKRYFTTDRYSDDTEKRRTDTSTYSIDGGTPAGVTLTPQGAEVDITYSGGDSTRKIVLVGTYPNGGRATLTIELVGNVCQRPANLAYKPQLVFNAVPASGGNARLFTSLDDANSTIGKHFDGTAPLNLSGSMFPAEMANYNVGTDVYYRWSPAYTSCEHVSDGIYPVLSGDGTNGQKLSIQIVAGKIAAVLTSTYVTPMPTDPATTVGSIVVYRSKDNDLVFLYRSDNIGDLDDNWAQFGAGWLPSASVFNTTHPYPELAQYQDHKYIDIYGTCYPYMLDALAGSNTFQIRKRGASAASLSITFTAPNLKLGEARQIYLKK